MPSQTKGFKVYKLFVSYKYLSKQGFKVYKLFIFYKYLANQRLHNLQSLCILLCFISTSQSRVFAFSYFLCTYKICHYFQLGGWGWAFQQPGFDSWTKSPSSRYEQSLECSKYRNHLKIAVHHNLTIYRWGQLLHRLLAPRLRRRNEEDQSMKREDFFIIYCNHSTSLYP